MRIWLVTIGEPIPVREGARDRLLRTGYFAHFLADHGHEVVWWTSTFDHFRKKHWFDRDHLFRVGDRLEIRLLHGCGYKSNVSLARFRDHNQIAAKFAAAAKEEHALADMIVTALPTIELCFESVNYGREHNIPVVLDIRDMWPDIFLDLLPDVFRPFGGIALAPMFRKARAACSRATAVAGVTEPFVDWGIKRGDRLRSPWDGSFGFGYVKKTPSAEAVLTGSEFWRTHEISRSSADFVVCFFGTMGRQFELGPVIDAARILQKQNRRIRFVLCGAGDRLEYYRSQAADCDNVLFPGWVGAAEIWSLLQMSSLGLAPYRETPNFVMNIANKPAEYLSGGLPIALGLREGVLYDLLDARNCGFSYRGDAKELARMVGNLYDDPEKLRFLRANARRVFAEQFEAEKVYGAMMDHLVEIAAGHAALKGAAA